jgi:hypothetical protein
MRLLRSRILPVVVAVVLALSAWPVNYYLRRQRINRFYHAVQVGESKQTLVARLGQPTTTHSCYPDLDNGCTEFRYYLLVERWVFVFDKDGKLIDKWCGIE